MLESPVLAMMTLAQMNSTVPPGASAPPTAGPAPAPAAPAPANPAAPATAGIAAPAHAGLAVPAPAARTAPAAGQTGVSTQPIAGATTQQTDKPAGSPLDSFIFPIIIMFVLLFLFLRRGQGKEEKRRKALLTEMKKGDKVQTVGGLIARVVAIDNDDVTLKIDESANVKAVYKKSAILNVIVPPDEKSK